MKIIALYKSSNVSILKDMEDKKLFTSAEVAEILSVHIRTVQRWDREGKIECVRTPGNHRRIPESEVERLINATKPQNTTDS